MNRSTSDAALRRLMDKDAIATTLARYCRGVDRCVEDLISDAYFPDGIDEHSYITLSGTEIGPFLVARMKAMYTSTLHCIVDSLIDLDGDVAHVETYMVGFLGRIEGDIEVADHVAARYVDRFECRSDEWRIAHRTVLPEFAMTIPKTEQTQLNYVSDTPKRSRDDISFRR